MQPETVVVGGAAGFWGEASHATAQLLAHEGLDFLVYDYLAEITMSILARARTKDAGLGYATDFVTAAMAPNLKEIAAKGVRVISNAGGLNPAACAAALRELVEKSGLDLKIAVVEGDDLSLRVNEFAEKTEMFSGQAFPSPEKVASVNAYLGAFPIAAALNAGADIVITGRCVDSAVTLAACIHSFDWGAEEFDRLAAGSLAGHILECGPQATGGNFTDWEAVGDISNIGYPIAEITTNGSFAVTKPAETSGLVTRATVAEQMLYEIGDPQNYLLPDVTADFSQVTLDQIEPDKVLVKNAVGRAPGSQLKVSATYADGFRAGYLFNFNGRDAGAKAQAFAEAGLTRAKAGLARMGASVYSETCIEITGGIPDDLPLMEPYEEVTLKAAVRHDDARAVGLFLKELIGAALAAPPGLSGFTGAGRPKPSPVVRLFSFLVEKNSVPVHVCLDGTDLGFKAPGICNQQQAGHPNEPPVTTGPASPQTTAPLEQLAWARSGDKGDMANIGVIARNPDYIPWIWQALDEAAIRGCFVEWLKGDVERFFLPGTCSMNIVMNKVLGGGGIASLLNDPQAKGYAQRLLALPVTLPESVITNNTGIE